MTHVLGLSVEVRGNKRSWQTLDIAYMFSPTSGFKKSQNFNLRNKITKKKNCNPHDFYLPTREKFATPNTSQDLAQKFSSGYLWTHLL
jgi:hypothetical protein